MNALVVRVFGDCVADPAAGTFMVRVVDSKAKSGDHKKARHDSFSLGMNQSTRKEDHWRESTVSMQVIALYSTSAGNNS